MTATYATLARVEARLSGRQDIPFGDATKPTASEVQSWLDEGQEMLDLALGGIGLPVPYTDAARRHMLGVLVTDYAEGMVRAHHAAAGGDSTNLDGQDLLTRFRVTLDEIVDQPQRWEMKLGGNIGKQARAPSSYQVSNREGLRPSRGDFSPVFKRGGKF